MSWVLILSPRNGPDPRYPAVIGGYRTKEEAIAAGDFATSDEVYDYPSWVNYTVIPGAADTPPETAATPSFDDFEKMMGGR